MSPQYGELRPTIVWDRLTSLGYPCKFQLVSRFGSVAARHLAVGVSQTLRRWTEGTTYIRQGDHHVGHWPTFLVITILLRKWCHNNKHFSELASHHGEKIAGIDMVWRNYVTVTVCITAHPSKTVDQPRAIRYGIPPAVSRLLCCLK